MKKQTGPVNYAVEISDQQTTKVYHVKKWLHHREPERAYVHVVTDEQEEPNLRTTGASKIWKALHTESS